MMNLYRAFFYLGIAAPALAQYAGPAILSRGDLPTSMAGAPIDFRPFLTVTGTYDTGLAGAAANAKGQLANTASYGMQFTGGLSGIHSWEHTKVGLDYTGSLNRYFEKTYFNRSNQSLSLGISHQFAEHFILNLKETAGTFSQNFNSLGVPETVLADSFQGGIPVTDFVDNRTSYLITQTDLILQKNARLSFDLGGSSSLVRQSALYGLDGASARGDVQYRLTEGSTIGAVYSYWNYNYTGLIGTTDVHSVSGTFTARLSQRWEFSGYGGASRQENKFAQAILLDPTVARLLGVSSVVGLAYGNHFVPTGSARLARTFRTGVFYVTGSRAVTPGNGLFLTSNTATGALGYTYTGLHYWSFTSQAQYQRANSVGNLVGTYADTSGSLSVTRRITGALHFVAGGDVRRYQSAVYSLYNRMVYNVYIGVGFAPGSVPLRMW